MQGRDQGAFILFEIVSRHGDGRPAVGRRIVHGLCKGPPIIGYANGRMGLRSEWSENGYVPADGLAEPRNRKCKGIGADDHQPLTRKVMTDDQGWRGVIAMFLRNAFSQPSIADPDSGSARSCKRSQIGERRIGRRHPLDDHFDTAATGQADVNQRTSGSIDDSAGLPVIDYLARIQRHVVFDAATRQKAPAFSRGDDHLCTNWPRAAIGLHDGGQGKGIAPICHLEHTRPDIVFEPAHQPGRVFSHACDLHPVCCDHASAGNRSRYLSTVIGYSRTRTPVAL